MESIARDTPAWQIEYDGNALRMGYGKFRRPVRLPGLHSKWENICSTKKDYIALYLGQRDGWQCHYCSKRLYPRDGWEQYRVRVVAPDGEVWYEEPKGMTRAEIDHMTPVCKGGTNSLDNLALCCDRCNTLKGSKDYIAFLIQIGQSMLQEAAK